VAYDPKVVTIWEGFLEYFRRRGLQVDYVLYSNYESQVEAHVRGQIDVAWNSPLAWVETIRIAKQLGRQASALCMRDSDRDLVSIVLVRTGSGIDQMSDLAGKIVGVGSQDSPQATLIPLNFLAEHGLVPTKTFQVTTFDALLGKHGDHIGGEREAVRALLKGAVDAACIIDANHLAFAREGTLPPGVTTILARTPPYDHCNFTVFDDAPTELVSRFRQALLDMSYGDEHVRPFMDLEGVKEWLPGRVDGYSQLLAAVDRFGMIKAFVDGVLSRCT
jgi:ABC-type phosphate/phosphonate transport system substrate-binding protein